MRSGAVPYLMVAPAIALFSAFVAWPMIELFILSFYRTDFITREFIGLGNYASLPGNEIFRQATINSLFYIILLVPGQVGLATFVSLLAFNLDKRWKDFARIAFYIPFLSAGVIIAQSWRWIFGQRGPANWLLSMAGIEPVAWFGQPTTAIPAVSLVLSLSAMGTYIIIILAAMEGIDKSIIDAARVDGASSAKIKTRIVLPMVLPQIAGCATLAAIGAPQIYETVNFLAPYDHAASMTFQIYNQAFRYSRHGLAAAMAVALMVATILAMLAKKRLDRG